MGCGDTLLDPIGSSIAGAIGFNSPADYAFSSPGDFGKMLKENWVAFKHLMVPDMRRDREAMTNSALTSRRWIYGNCRVSGQLAYAETSGDKNQYLHLIMILASHPICGFGDIYLDDQLLTGTQTNPMAQNTTYRLFNGTQTTACEEMVAVSGGKWTAAHVLKGCAYIYLKLTYNEAAFPSGLPVVKVVVYGKPVYDTRTSSIYSPPDVGAPYVKSVYKPVADDSGSGSNHGFLALDNPAMCIRDYMLTPENLGGMGCSADEIDEQSFIDAANICDQMVYKKTDGSINERRFTCSGTFTIDSTPKKIIDALLQSMAGSAIFAQDKWRIFAGACGSTTGLTVIDESWLNGGISFKLGANKGSKINTIKGTFVDPEDDWASKGFPPVTSAAYIAADGDEELAEDLTLNFTISLSMAQRIGKIIMEQSRRGLVIDYPCNLKAFKLTPHQLVRVNNTLLGFSNKLMRVLDWEFSATGGVKLTLGEEDPAIYDWTPGDVVELTPVPLTNLPDPNLVYPPTGIICTPRIYDYNSGTSTRVDLDISWQAAGPGQPSYELQYRLTGGNWSGIISLGRDLLYTLTTLTTGTYEIRIRSINAIGSVSEWVLVTQFVPLPDITVPNVTGLELFGQGNGTSFVGKDIALRWNYVSPRGDTSLSGPGRGSSWFKYYVVEVYTAGDVLLRTDYRAAENYTYSYEMNRQDGSGTAARTVKFSVKIMSAWGALSATAATITVSNPNIAKLIGIGLTGGINVFTVTLPAVTEPDFAGYDIYASLTAGFVPGAGNKINGGGPETVVTKINAAPGTWYIRVAGRDTFGADGQNYSDEQSVVVSSLTVTPEMLDATTRTDFLLRDSILYFNGSTLNWGAGYIDRTGSTYTLAAGTLAAANASYIIATLENVGHTAALSKTAVSAGLPTLTANQIVLAVSSGNQTPQGNYYCYVRQANSIAIEGALIREATITEAHLLELTFNKITSGTNLIIDATIDGYGAAIQVTTIDDGGAIQAIANDRNAVAPAIFARSGQKLSPGTPEPAIVAQCYGGIGAVISGTLAPLCLVPDISNAAPTHTARIGSLWMSNGGILYSCIRDVGVSVYELNSNVWQKVGAQ